MKYSLDQVPRIRGLQRFLDLSSSFCKWRMDDDRWYLANIIFYSAPWRRMLQEARVIDMKLLAVIRQRL